MIVSRKLELTGLLDKKQSFLLFGPRGTGKTSLMKTVLQKKDRVIRIDLLRADAYRHYLTAPEALGEELRRELNNKEKSPLYVLIDEIQKIPPLLDEVHSLLEEKKGRVVFALTGSSARKLKRVGANLLGGRAITKFLHPLNSREIEVQLSRALQFGTLPGIYLESHFEIERLETYVTTYLKEEILEEALVRQVDKFARFLELSAQLNGEPINFTKLAKQCSVSTKTAQEYFEILCDTLVVKRIDGWAHSVKRQLMQAPRFWFFDCGVLNALNGDLRSVLKPSTFRYGKLFETWAVQEIVRLNDDSNLGLRLNYWRDSTGNEVDLIVSKSTAQPRVAIEIKSAEHPTPSDVKPLKLFALDYPKVKLLCLCRTSRAYKMDGIEFLPLGEGLTVLQRLP